MLFGALEREGREGYRTLTMGIHDRYFDSALPLFVGLVLGDSLIDAFWLVYANAVGRLLYSP